ARIWLGRVLWRDHVRGLRLCRLCGLVRRPPGRWRHASNEFHAPCWRALLASRRAIGAYPSGKLLDRGRGQPRHRYLDRDFWWLLARSAGMSLEEARARVPKGLLHGPRPRHFSTVSDGIEALTDVLPGDAALFLPLPRRRRKGGGAECFEQVVGSLRNLLTDRIARGDRNEVMRKLDGHGMPHLDIGRLTGATLERVRATVNCEERNAPAAMRDGFLQQLRADLSARGLTPYAAARQAGLNGTTVEKWFRGRKPSVQVLKRLLDANAIPRQQYRPWCDELEPPRSS